MRHSERLVALAFGGAHAQNSDAGGQRETQSTHDGEVHDCMLEVPSRAPRATRHDLAKLLRLFAFPYFSQYSVTAGVAQSTRPGAREAKTRRCKANQATTSKLWAVHTKLPAAAARPADAVESTGSFSTRDGCIYITTYLKECGRMRRDQRSSTIRCAARRTGGVHACKTAHESQMQEGPSGEKETRVRRGVRVSCQRRTRGTPRQSHIRRDGDEL
ncbi:hypothetical protein VTO73DRAFT_13076 [Trametes versicolor]